MGLLHFLVDCVPHAKITPRDIRIFFDILKRIINKLGWLLLFLAVAAARAGVVVGVFSSTLFYFLIRNELVENVSMQRLLFLLEHSLVGVCIWRLTEKTGLYRLILLLDPLTRLLGCTPG